MARRKLPTHIDVSVWCYDDAAEPDGYRAFATVKVPVTSPYKVPEADREWLLAELGYGDIDRDAGNFEPSLLIFGQDVDATLKAAGFKI